MRFFIGLSLALFLSTSAFASSAHKNQSTKAGIAAKKKTRASKKSKRKGGHKSHQRPQQVLNSGDRPERRLASASSSSMPHLDTHLGAHYVSKYFQRDSHGVPGAEK